jgi:cysteine synthase B
MTAQSLSSRTSIQISRTVLPEVGNTPLVRLERITTGLVDAVEIWSKCEWTNPSGSVKDRPAHAILRRALDRGEIDDGQTLLDSTSGNMGIAYATLAAPLGLPIHMAVPANASAERLAILRALGAQLTLTDPTEGSDGARRVAAQMAAEQPATFYFADQYNHPANWESHFATTGPELLAQTNGRMTHFVAGLGTTGTVTGVGRYLQQHAPHVRVVGVQPATPLHGL